jgi:hypothetical protein
MSKKIYLGDQTPAIFHILKNSKSELASDFLILSLEKRNTEHLNLMLWSSVEIQLFIDFFKKDKGHNISFNSQNMVFNMSFGKIIIGGDGLENLIEIIRKSGVGLGNFDTLMSLHIGFHKTYYKFMKGLISFGQYNNIDLQGYLDDLPKSYKNFLSDLINSDFGNEFIAEVSKVLGGGPYSSKMLSILFISKILCGIHLVDLKDIINALIPNFINTKELNYLKVENLGEKTSKLSFTGYEGSEIASFDQLYCSELFDKNYLRQYSLSSPIYSNDCRKFSLGKFTFESEDTFGPTLVILNNLKLNKRQDFIKEFRGSSENKNMAISTVEFNLIKYVESNPFGIGPYLTYLFSPN